MESLQSESSTGCNHRKSPVERPMAPPRGVASRGMKLIYQPFGIIMGILAGLVGKRVFNVVWGVIDDEDPPKPTTQRVSWVRVLSAAAVQGMIFKVVRAAVDRAGA